jgi:hypothetical protein
VYWDFFDHFLPLSERSMAEALEISGFKLEKAIAQFLPYTMREKLPPHPLLVPLCLALPIFRRILGKAVPDFCPESRNSAVTDFYWGKA